MSTSEEARRYHVVGRLRGITPRRLESLLAAVGASLTRSPRAAHAVVLAHSSAAKWIGAEGGLRTPLGAVSEKLISERSFRRLLGYPESWQSGPYAAAELARVSGLDLDVVRRLALFDIFEGAPDGFTFADFSASKRIAGWLSSGYELAEVVTALHRALLRGDRIGAIELVRLGSRRIGARVAGAIGDLDGQLMLPIDLQEPDLDETFDAAFEAEESGDLERAARLYEVAARMDPRDAVIQFNYGNVLGAAGRLAEADVAYGRAVALEPGFSDAWFNIGLIAERKPHRERAKQAFERAVAADPLNLAAKFRLARLLTSASAYSEAIPLWDELARDGDPETQAEAKKWATISRLQMKDAERR